ncbi:MAG: DUF3426 domain-containing protein [Gammaproteobacteria bacterium]|nr:DUF3426 domain-containing protein [Gammaproteobacteria bacterium]MBU1972409.1 DUF3426 domain-containing protein [Gammaproteobacteria bacterium]
MLTRCPNCVTTFRVTPEQLKARQGRVRCGQCEQVFNALETLVEEAAPAAVVVTEVAVAAAEPTIESPEIEATPFAPPEPPPTPAAEITGGATLQSPEPGAVEAVAEPGKDSPTVRPATTPEPQTLVDYEPTFEDLLAEEPPRRAWPWVLGVVFALLVLSGQAIHHFRVELALIAPEAKPALAAFCDMAGCDLPLPRKVGLVGIDSSDLHPDPANAAQLLLVATIKNRAPFAQAYPHLELTLTDTADKALLRRVLAPADYLPKAKPVDDGFAASADLALRLTLEVKDLAAVGYRLYVFYP